MPYIIEIQYKPIGKDRPYDERQRDDLTFKQGEFIPIPEVGDTVSYHDGEEDVFRKVLTRHFSYTNVNNDYYYVTLVVTDVDPQEQDAREKS